MRFSLFRNRIWGFRLIEVSAFVFLLVLAVSVYLAKVWGGQDAQEITRIEREIVGEKQRIRLLQAEVAHQEQPERIVRLSGYLALAPTSAKQEVAADGLVDVARGVKRP